MFYQRLRSPLCVLDLSGNFYPNGLFWKDSFSTNSTLSSMVFLGSTSVSTSSLQTLFCSCPYFRDSVLPRPRRSPRPYYHDTELFTLHPRPLCLLRRGGPNGFFVITPGTMEERIPLEHFWLPFHSENTRKSFRNRMTSYAISTFRPTILSPSSRRWTNN